MTKIKKILLFSICILFLFVIVIFFQLSKNNINIIFTDDGFSPKSIIINRGDTVTFINQSQKNMWPASDYHPSHGIYKAFDSQKPLMPGERWKFKFNISGSWTYHDHLSSLRKGKILVRGNTQDAQGCTHFLQNTVKARCFETKLTDIIQKKGFAAVFKEIKKGYEIDPVFKQNCHDIMHIIGEIAYKKYIQDGTIVLEQKTNYCGYGFYHGFIESILLNSNDLTSAKKYCNFLSTPGLFESSVWGEVARAACLHGIGHGVFDSHPLYSHEDAENGVTAGIEWCEKLFSASEDQTQCSSGIFNALANAYGNSGYLFSFDKETFNHANPIQICEIQKKKYQKRCYMEVGIAYVEYKHLGHEKNVAFFKTFKDIESVAGTLFAYIDNQIRRGRESKESVHSFCASLQDDILREACVEGGITGFSSSISDQAYEQTLAFCEMFVPGNSVYDFCIKRAFTEFKKIYTKEQLRDICFTTSFKNFFSC